MVKSVAHLVPVNVRREDLILSVPRTEVPAKELNEMEIERDAETTYNVDEDEAKINGHISDEDAERDEEEAGRMVTPEMEHRRPQRVGRRPAWWSDFVHDEE